MPEHRPQDPASRPDVEAGFEHLRAGPDPVIAALVSRIGPLDRTRRRRGRPKDAYGALVRSIVGQQLSTKAARTIYERLTALFGGRTPSPAEVLAAGEADLRAAGLSGRKAEYLRELARHAESGELDLGSLHLLTDEEVADRLVAVRGLGRWTADMFLMFHLDRPDVLPVGDLGIRRAAQKAYSLSEMPSPGELRGLSHPWRPHRTLACIYLWESLDAPPEDGPGG
ncbi:DNA-3-methyladenine glycosylase family protein [Rubrobacter aplysinae]|uniref:DNA-3-methyladenine glycosylase family protein n=1 Tax=Rubrobacter aplysinae TaxID=909625 RepID=UPI00064BBD02|nr:DNA-3-methyladenine glycosylase [Rubrobacter aplysinae]